jgi:signal transduction histidine kinase
LKLTALYIGIIAVILIIFSLILYYSISKNIHDNFEGGDSNENDQAQTLLITKTTDQLQTTIFFIDLIILFVSSGLSYFLAGKTLKPIQQAMEKQKQFTADASHELRTPLAVMQTNLEVVLREKEWNKEKERALIVSAVDEVKLMTKMTQDLLTLSRLESKQEVYSLNRINLAQIAEQATRKIQNIATKNQIQLSTVYSESIFIKGDAEAAQQLITNILSNAIKFTPAGGSVNITVSRHDAKAIIRVQDTGMGIAKEDLSHVFERFYRADRARGQGGGTGLGLSIAQEIVRKHNGAITIESEIGKGTLVTIVFHVAS